MLKTILPWIKRLGLGLAIVSILLIIASLFFGSEIEVERSITINAPVDSVFKEVNVLSNWEHWSPWESENPYQKTTYSGPKEGKGAKASWKSRNNKSNSGTTKIVKSVPNETIVTSTRSESGRKSSEGTWTFEKTDEGVKVSWKVTAYLGVNPITKLFSSKLEKIMSENYFKGLKKMKERCERLAKDS